MVPSIWVVVVEIEIPRKQFAGRKKVAREEQEGISMELSVWI